MFKNKLIRKRYIGIDITMLGIIVVFLISFITYKTLEIKAISNINKDLKRDINLRANISDPSTTLENKIFSFLKESGGKLFYLQGEADLEKLNTRKFCNATSLLILNGKNFEEIDVEKLQSENGIYVRPIDRLYVYHCYFKFKLFDSTFSRIK